MQAHDITKKVVLDDGEFRVVLRADQAADMAGGVLERRCLVSPSTPHGYARVGDFRQDESGEWSAAIAAPYDRTLDRDCLVVAAAAPRIDAIVRLWKARQDAYFGQHSL